MSDAVVFYTVTLIVYGVVDVIACLGLSQQFGVAGVTNFGFIIFQAAGAYTASVLSLPSDHANGGFQLYVGGLNLPFPLPWIGAAIVGGLVALPFVFLVGKRLRGDYVAIGLLVAAVMANLIVTNYRSFLNGAAGLSLVPSPLQSRLNPQSLRYQWGYAVVGILLALLTFWFCRRLTESPYGRALRAMRENDLVADSLGKNLRVLRAQMLVVGGAIAGLSGGVLVGFINLWAPSAWGYAETIVLFAAVIIGGAGNHLGAVLGAILVPLGFEEATRFVPAFGPPGLIPAFQWVAIGLLVVIFLRLRPQGILPERRRRLATPAAVSGLTTGDSLASLPLGRRPGPSHGRDRHDDVLEVRGVSREFGGVRAVDDVSFVLKEGHLTGLIGPNGAGKSTTLALLAGTVPVTGGRIVYRGQDITTMPAYQRARHGIIRTFQLASEFKRLTVLENLLSAVPDQPGESFMGAVAGRRHWRAAEKVHLADAAALLERFGLSAQSNAYAGELSGGQRRLVEIMRALMARPDLLLLDEPMAGVHPELAALIGEELLRLCSRGMTIVMVEHELSYMDRFCDPVIVMSEGRVLAEGAMTDLRRRPEVVEAYLVG
ncbi:MAG TPA: branched-chain amino acid ABC transporter ATP-binding protein/permease [Nocardioidaceae bacterium]|nr:branched-chain amino acid ABC transporter ATP-binding protein/permease [Nocardioidaceae bacterium]